MKKLSSLTAIAIVMIMAIAVLPSCSVDRSPGIPALVFTHKATYNIPPSSVGSAISEIDLAPAVSGGVKPYEFSATGFPPGLEISSAGLIYGAPSAARAQGEATVTVMDSSIPTQYKSIKIVFAAVSPAAEPAKPAPNSVTVSKQEALLYAGTAGAATFTVTTSGIDAGTIGSVKWGHPNEGEAPVGLTTAVIEAVKNNYAVMTIKIDSKAQKGEYTFAVDMNGIVSQTVTLAINSPLIDAFAVDDLHYKRINTEDNAVELIYNGTLSYAGNISVPGSVRYSDNDYVVKRINGNVFTNGSALQTISLSASVNHVDLQPNSDCPRLRFEVDKANADFFAESGALYNMFDNNNDGQKEYISLIWIPRNHSGEFVVAQGTRWLSIYSGITKLTKLNIPSSVVKTSDPGAFGDCPQLTDVTLNWADPASVGMTNPDTYFAGTTVRANITLHVPAGTVKIYEAHPLWGKGFKQIVEQSAR